MPMIDSPALFEDAAIQEWTQNQALSENGKVAVTYYGYVQCFCDDKKALGDLSTDLYGG